MSLALLYADDIVLLAENEKQLCKMLVIADNFAVKWGLKFNSRKSKVLIIGKRVDPLRKWVLGNSCIEEANTYRYLGTIFSRTLSDLTHVKEYLVPKLRKLRGYITSILAKHDDINRIVFGNTLYRHVALPSLLHGCGIWMENTCTSKKQLRSFQYNLARSILRIKASPAYLATIGDLGWLPLSHEADKRRINYFNYVKYRTESQRLCNIVFKEMYKRFEQGRGSSWPYFVEIKNILNYAGMDWAFYSDNGDWLPRFSHLQTEAWNLEFFKQLDELPTLDLYKRFKTDTSLENYMLNIRDFNGVKNKFRARTATLGLNNDQERWGVRDSSCDFCGSHREDIFHVFFSCPTYTDIRSDLFYGIEVQLLENGLSFLWEEFMASSLLNKIKFLIGYVAKLHSKCAFQIFNKDI